MPSFLNKVFGYRKHDDKETARPSREASDSTLLDGKYEAIAPVLSPTASTFVEAQQTKDTDRDVGFSLFRPKARGASQKHARKHPEDIPHLTLHLPGPKENSDSRSLGVVFEADPDSQIVLDDAVIAAKRLSPLEALILIRACTQAITERGLETLGVMHPHWFSASPDVQRRLISLFIRSLTQNNITTLPPTPTSSTSAFENELHYTRSPHDVAAVLRWGLRHLSLENGHFGKDSTEWGWYNTFFQAERNASYPLKGFSELLLPQLPTSHIELLTMTLGLISSLASHAETNSISGSKLSKFLGLWLLVATRAEDSDDWNQFYARWERGGRILEHLFLARLREESSRQRLPTRLQELVKYYPYNKGSPAMDNDLLSRPRFSTRQYDALFVRIETLLEHSSQRPKQHPIRLLLEAFQLPVDNPSANEHIELWNTLKTTVFGDVASSDPEGPQFTRIFVDETIRLLSLIPVDSSLATSPTLLTSPITKAVSRKRSSSLTKALERAVSKPNAINGSTPISPPASPTSPSSIVITDWAQFTLSGFGDTPSTQPLATLLSQDDDIEVTQPRISRKSSRHRGKSRSRRRRSEDHEPLDTPPSSQPDPDPSIIETKLATVHVIQIDEAFIDFWSDAIVDPISANWPTFVVCGLKPIPNAEQPIRWLVIEQAYSRQEPSRAPSPDGRRGRSPRPSFKSDISGFRINSVFSSARKRFSMFSKSVTDLDLKKSGGKSPVVGELGEVLVEEEPTFPSAPPTQAGLHVDGNAAVNAAVMNAAAADVADQLKVGEISTMPIAGVPPAGEPDLIQVAVKAPSIEASSRSEGGHSGPSVLPHLSVRASEETISVQRDSSRTLDVVNPKVDNAASSIIGPMTADTPSRPTQGTCVPTLLASGSAPSVENSVAGVVHVHAENVRPSIAVESEDRPVEHVPQTVDRDEHLHTETTGMPSNAVQVDVVNDGSREDTQAVAMHLPPETVALVSAAPVVQPAVVAAVDDGVPEPAIDGPYVAIQPLQKASTNPVAAFTVESVGGHEIDDLSPLSATVIATETGAQLEPPSISSVVDEEAQEVAEHAEIPTPAPELVALVEETPNQVASVDVCEHAGAARTPTALPAVLDSATPQLVALDDAASQPVAAESQATLQAGVSFVPYLVEAPAAKVVDTSVEVAVAETEPAADQVPQPVAEAARSHVQDAITQAAEARLIKVEVDVSADTVSASQAEDVAPAEVEAQAAPEGFIHEDVVVETQDTAMPACVPEHVVLVDETASPVIAADALEPIEAASAITPEFEEVEAKTAEEAQPCSGAEPPTQPAAEASSTNSEVTTAALATLDEASGVTADTKTTHDALAEDAEARTPAPERPSVEDTLEVAVEASELVPSAVVEPEPIDHKAPEPVAEEALVLVEAAPIASEPVAITPIVPTEEPVAQDVQAPIEIDQPSSAPAPQFVVDPPVSVVVSAPEQVVEEQVEHPTADTADDSLVEDAKPATLALVKETRVDVDACEPEILAAEPELVEGNAQAPDVQDASADVEVEEPSASEQVVASRPEISKTPEIDEPHKVVHPAESVMTDISASTHDPAGPVEEIARTEP